MVTVTNSRVSNEAVKANYTEIISVALASISHILLHQEAQGCIQDWVLTLMAPSRREFLSQMGTDNQINQINRNNSKLNQFDCILYELFESQRILHRFYCLAISGTSPTKLQTPMYSVSRSQSHSVRWPIWYGLKMSSAPRLTQHTSKAKYSEKESSRHLSLLCLPSDM